MNIALNNPSQELSEMVTLLSGVMETDESLIKDNFKAIDKRAGEVFSSVLNVLTDKESGNINGLTESIVNQIKPEDWYFLNFHFVFKTLNKNKGQINYLINNAIINYNESNGIPPNAELSVIDITNIFYESYFDVFAVSMVIEDLLKDFQRQQENVAKEAKE